MRVLILGGTAFIGRRVVERLHERGDDVLVVHRGRREPANWVPVGHLHTDRHALHDHADAVRRFAPESIVDAYALTAQDVAAVLPVLPEVPTVVLSSQDVYQAYSALNAGRCEAPVPLTEDSELRRQRYPRREAGSAGIPEDYEKLDVERLWLDRGAAVLRLPMVYGPHDQQRREDLVLLGAADRAGGRRLVRAGARPRRAPARRAGSDRGARPAPARLREPGRAAAGLGAERSRAASGRLRSVASGPPAAAPVDNRGRPRG